MNQQPNAKNMQFITDNMEDAVCVTTKSGYLQFANAAAMTLLGITSEEIPEKRIWELFPLVEENDNLIQLFIDAMTTGENTREQLVNYVNAAGQLSQLRVCLRYSREDGLFLIIMTDLTQLIKVMSAFARYTSPQIAAYVLGSPEGERQGGVSRTVSILMSDLRGFTSMGASMEPERSTTISMAMPCVTSLTCSWPSCGRASATVSSVQASAARAAGSQRSLTRQVRGSAASGATVATRKAGRRGRRTRPPCPEGVVCWP